MVHVCSYLSSNTPIKSLITFLTVLDSHLFCMECLENTFLRQYCQESYQKLIYVLLLNLKY